MNKEYSNEEILDHVKFLLKDREGYGAFGEREVEPPYKNDVKSAEIIKQLLRDGRKRN